MPVSCFAGGRPFAPRRYGERMSISRSGPAVVALACLAACSSSGPSTTGPSTGGPSTGGTSARPGPPVNAGLQSGAAPVATDKPCGSLKTADVSAAVGFAAAEPLTKVTGPITICQYAGSVGSAVLIRVEKGMGADAFKAAQKALNDAGQKTVPLSGVGDESYSSVLNPNGKNVAYTVGARKGGSDVLVTVAGSTASVGRATALAMAVLDGFGM